MMAPPHTAAAPRNTIETYSSRPDRDLPRNEKGEIVCTHEACIGKSEVFRRPCEWNKHMDKHERPYKCNEPTCEQNPGFTYSGGLLRHMREVHKKGVGPSRRPLFCPHANCIRSSGEGFTRRENLEEHLRRRHQHQGPYNPPENSDDSKLDANEEIGDRVPKRRRTEDSTSPTDNAQISLPIGTPYMNNVAAQAAQETLTNTDPSLLEPSHFHGESRESNHNGANSQLSQALQQIREQEEVIRQQQLRIDQLEHAFRSRSSEYRYSDSNLNGNSYISNHINSPIQQSPTANGDNVMPGLIEAAQAAHAAAPHHDIPLAPELAQADNGYMPYVADHDTDRQATPAQRSENSSEPSRRIEIERDLVAEKAQQAQATAQAGMAVTNGTQHDASMKQSVETDAV